MHQLSEELVELMKQADRLAPKDQLRLASYILEKISHCEIKPIPRQSVKEFRGIAPNHLGGMDAQEYVNRIRRGEFPEWEIESRNEV
ncbi:MAG: hypothetical protein DSM106950_17655 [Stigonema ocellatum SAG 48.90 = DSM 106950]|nr:hypothetical protein [Stigonema ocellatum SAG 48.90 = DSM 106950]